VPVTMRAQLVPIEGGAPLEILKDLCVVGRKEDCELRIDHKSVSKHHCVIVRTDGLLLIRDLGSTNGTRVNGTRVRRAALLPNDRLSFAGFHFRVLFGAALDAYFPSEQTQQINEAELAKVLGVAPPAIAVPDAVGDSDIDIPVVEVQHNLLPDVYPDDEKKK
jgi:hypothetical protein